MDLDKKVIVITGGSEGLGKSLAKAFKEANANVIICAKNNKKLLTVAKEINAIPFIADVTKENDIKSLANFAIKKFGTIDIWINNAGITQPYDSIENINLKRGHQIMETNLFGTIYGSRVAFSIMKPKKKGVIINIISVHAFAGRPQSSIYTASKWAVRGFTKSLALASKPEKILIMAVYPAGMKTKLFGSKNDRKGYKKFMEPSSVANKIIKNLKRKKPSSELIIKK